MRADRFFIMRVAIFTFVSSVVAMSHSVAQSSPTALGTTLFRDLARSVNPVVVSVMAWSRPLGSGEGKDDIFRFFKLDPPLDRQGRLATGSGFLISGTEILTNNHVVEGAERIEISLLGNERKRYRAVLVGSDPLTDSALIRLQNPPPDLQAATFGDSDELASGDWVIAIGNPFLLAHSVTVGVVSFPSRAFQVQDRWWQDLIQTDTAINLGSSGGPLFNLRGEVVGINVALLEGDSGANAGIGFAVPMNTVKALLPQLRNGKVVRGQLGVQLHDGPILEDEANVLHLPKAAGAIVLSVDEGSAAEQAGLRAGDVIVEIDGNAVAETRDLIARVASTAPGARATVRIFRNGKEQTHTTIIEEQPVDEVEEPSAEDSDGDAGLTLGEIPPQGTNQLAVTTAGAWVIKIAPDSPADDAELAVGDIIRAINGHAIHTPHEVRRELRRIEPDRPIFLVVARYGKELFLEMRKR